MPGRARVTPSVRLLEVDPDLAREVPEARAPAAAAALLTTVPEVDPGRWDPGPALGGPEARAGMIVLDGLVAQDIVLTGATATELLGQGDFVHPREVDPGLHPFVATEIRWTALETSTVALLDAQFEKTLRAWPEVSGPRPVATLRRRA